MYDTVALSKTSFRGPSKTQLERYGAKYRYRQGDKDPYQVIINGAPAAHEPRITVTRFQGRGYFIRPEVSIGAWLFGSNVDLPSMSDIAFFLEAIQDYVGERTGIVMDSRKARVSRLDITRDYVCDPLRIRKVIDDLRNYEFPKRMATLVGGTTVYFRSRGKRVARETLIYSKWHEMASGRATKEHLEKTVGIVRLEDRHRTNSAVIGLMKSLGLPDHSAACMLSEYVHSAVIAKLETALGLSTITLEGAPIRLLYEELGSTQARHVLAHLALKNEFGPDYFDDQAFGTSKRVARQRDRQAARCGLFCLE